MMKALGISIATLICSLILKDKNKTFALVLSIAGASLLFGTVIADFSKVVNGIIDYTGDINLSLPYIRLMLKVLGITLSTQIVSDVCRDNGENALASMTEMVSKILVISLILPLFETVISIVNGLVK